MLENKFIKISHRKLPLQKDRCKKCFLLSNIQTLGITAPYLSKCNSRTSHKYPHLFTVRRELSLPRSCARKQIISVWSLLHKPCLAAARLILQPYVFTCYLKSGLSLYQRVWLRLNDLKLCGTSSTRLLCLLCTATYPPLTEVWWFVWRKAHSKCHAQHWQCPLWQPAHLSIAGNRPRAGVR